MEKLKGGVPYGEGSASVVRAKDRCSFGYYREQSALWFEQRVLCPVSRVVCPFCLKEVFPKCVNIGRYRGVVYFSFPLASPYWAYTMTP